MMMIIMMMEGIILTVILGLLLLGTTSASEVNCESPVRNKTVVFNVQLETEFCLWYKMDEFTQVNATYIVNIWDDNLLPAINYSDVWSNTEEYTTISSADMLTSLQKTSPRIQQINSVRITGNATMEWIKCNNCQSFPAVTNIVTVNCSATNNTATVVALVVLVLWMVTLAVSTVYKHHLKKKSSHSVSLSPGEAAPVSTVGQEEHTYEEWVDRQLRARSPSYITVNNLYDDTKNTAEQERPNDWISSHIQDGLSHNTENTTAQQMQPSGRSSNHDIENTTAQQLQASGPSANQDIENDGYLNMNINPPSALSTTGRTN